MVGVAQATIVQRMIDMGKEAVDAILVNVGIGSSGVQNHTMFLCPGLGTGTGSIEAKRVVGCDE